MNASLDSGRDAAGNRGESVVAAADQAALLDVRAVAALLGCSTRHVYRLSDGGKMPAPIRLGALVRWSRAALDAWLTDGCKPIRAAAPKGGGR